MHYTGLDDHGTRYSFLRVILHARISALKLRNGNNNNRITNNLTNNKINNQYTLTMKREQEQKHS